MNKAFVLALVVLAAAVLAITPAARAGASNSYLCESSGSYCTGSAGTAWGDPVVERNPNGREIAWEPDGGCYIFEQTCWPTGKLKFYGVGSNTCLVASGGGDGSKAVLGACNATGVVWWWFQPSGQQHAEFGNRNATQQMGGPEMLSGRDVLGDQFTVQCWDVWCGDNSFFQRFDFVTA